MAMRPTDREIEAWKRAWEACVEYRKNGPQPSNAISCAVYDAGAPIEPEPLTEEELTYLADHTNEPDRCFVTCARAQKKAAAWIRWRMAEDRR